jgi:hypothetical protein
MSSKLLSPQLESDSVALRTDLDADTARIDGLQAAVTQLQSDTSGVADLLSVVTTDAVAQSVVFSGVNVYVQSGSGSTYGTVNGTGNLIVGYDEDDGSDDKSGSHNLVVGDNHTYTSRGGLIAGYDNSLGGIGTSVLGGMLNQATGNYAVVGGGRENLSSGGQAVVHGGRSNEARGNRSAVLGGASNIARAANSTISGGANNETTGTNSSVSGGNGNLASGGSATVAGGHNLEAHSNYSVVP